MDIIMNERLYCAHHKSLNDPFEGLFSTIEMKRIPQVIDLSRNSFGFGGDVICLGGRHSGPMIIGGGKRRKIVYKTINELPALGNNTRICSLSSSMSDVRMWSLYASGHTGCVIEVDLEPDGKEIVEVKYDSGIQHFKNKLTKDTKAVDILSFKTDHWKYEKEYRIVSEQEFYPTPGKITGIYLGIRAQEIHKKLVISCTPKEIPVYETNIYEKTVEITAKVRLN